MINPTTGRFVAIPVTLKRIKSNCDIDAKTGCWNWKGARTRFGYGKLRSGGKDFTTHRVAWTLSNGAPPKGAVVMHKCDNPSCCNPNHLKTGSDADNISDCVAKGRNAFGVKQHLSKLTPEVVMEIVRSKETGPVIAKRLGVTHGTIYQIRNGRIWKQTTGLTYAPIKK